MTAKNIYNKTYEEKVTDDKKVISIKKEERSNLQDKYRNTQSKIKSLDEDIKRMEERRLGTHRRIQGSPGRSMER